MAKTENIKALGFKDAYFVKGRSSVADIFKPNNRCGIYILCFENNQYYVGLAVDVVRRYNQHRKNHLDIIAMYFKQVPKKDLANEEKVIVQDLETKGFVLRNIALVSIVEGETDLDLIIPQNLQDKFLNELSFNNNSGNKFEIEEQRIKYQKNFRTIQQLPYYDKLIQVLHQYVTIGIPFPLQTEYSFWSISAPSGKDLVSRINIHWQEVCTFILEKDDFWVTFHLAKSPLEKVLKPFFRTFKSLELMVNKDGSNHQYSPGGQDQIAFIISSTEVEAFLNNAKIKAAIRLFNLRLMRKGATIYNRYHCFDLAKQVLKPVTIP